MGQDRSRSATSTRRRGQGSMGEHGGPRSGQRWLSRDSSRQPVQIEMHVRGLVIAQRVTKLGLHVGVTAADNKVAGNEHLD
jgi:hypothetical protein